MGNWEQHIEAQNWFEPALPKVFDYYDPEDNPDNVVDGNAECPICGYKVLKWDEHIHYPAPNGCWKVYHVDCLRDNYKRMFEMFGYPIEVEDD